jgi:hypothetical protein
MLVWYERPGAIPSAKKAKSQHPTAETSSNEPRDSTILTVGKAGQFDELMEAE